MNLYNIIKDLSEEKQKQILELPTIELGTQAKDYTGKRQGQITFLKIAEKKNHRAYWWILCDCGNIEEIRADSPKIMCDKCRKKEVSKQFKGQNMKDLTGQTFGYLTALYPLEKRVNQNIMWHCKCICGQEHDVLAGSLMSGNTKSCGCKKSENAYFKKYKQNLVGKQYGYLTVIEETDMREYGGKVVWKCKCICGNIVYANTNQLNTGNVVSCGCKHASVGVQIIKDILKNNNIIFQTEYIIKGINNKRFDFAIFDNNKNLIRFIEYDGGQHYYSTGGWNTEENLKITQKRDKEKNEYALSHNIPLVRIPYWERDNITLEMLMGDQYLIKD